MKSLVCVAGEKGEGEEGGREGENPPPFSLPPIPYPFRRLLRRL